jgi:hemerythrin
MDYLTIINKTIEAHRVIRGHIKLVGEAIPDKEALFNLSRESPNWLPGQARLAEKQQKLQQTLSALDEGLKNHFAFEEKYLPPLLGEFLLRALLADHRLIKDELSNAKSMAFDTNLTALNPEEIAAYQFRIHQKINGLREMVEEHATREDVVLNWLKRALQETKAPS